jgi:hypothetical protein
VDLRRQCAAGMQLLSEMQQANAEGSHSRTRELSLAITRMQEALYWLQQAADHAVEPERHRG